MKPLILILSLVLLSGTAYAGTGWNCPRGDGGMVYTVSCCSPEGKRFALGSNTDYPYCPNDSDYKKCEINAPFWSGRDTIHEEIAEQDKVEREKYLEICEARGPEKEFKGYPILMAYNSCPKDRIPCITYVETGKTYKPKK